MAVKPEAVSITTESVTKGYEQTVASLKDGAAQATAGFEKAQKTAEEAFAFSQGTIEAITKSGQIWSAGVQDLSKQFVATAQASIEETVERFKALASVKSLQDAIDLQSSLVRASTEKAIAETSRLTTASIKLTEEVMAPITARVGLAVEKFTKAA